LDACPCFLVEARQVRERDRKDLATDRPRYVFDPRQRLVPDFLCAPLHGELARRRGAQAALDFHTPVRELDSDRATGFVSTPGNVWFSFARGRLEAVERRGQKAEKRGLSRFVGAEDDDERPEAGGSRVQTR
jgi:hypothetical protein